MDVEVILREVARLLDVEVIPQLAYITPGEAMYMQAQIMQEIARRLVALEKS
jgi:hypothetical protein